MEDLEIRFTELKNIREKLKQGIAIDEEAFQLKCKKLN
jgi:formiminotetrahydrofolate cyclodeaminase